MSEIKTPWNPSKKATAKVKDRVDVPCECRYCQHEISIEKNSVVYNGREFGEWPWIYYCAGCKSYVGMHPYTNIPLGTIADAKTRDARKTVKAQFYAFMENTGAKRTEAYRLLAGMMEIDPSSCHFGWFDVRECNAAKQALDKLIAGERPADPNSPFAGLKTLLSKR